MRSALAFTIIIAIGSIINIVKAFMRNIKVLSWRELNFPVIHLPPLCGKFQIQTTKPPTGYLVFPKISSHLSSIGLFPWLTNHSPLITFNHFLLHSFLFVYYVHSCLAHQGWKALISLLCLSFPISVSLPFISSKCPLAGRAFPPLQPFLSIPHTACKEKQGEGR